MSCSRLQFRAALAGLALALGCGGSGWAEYRGRSAPPVLTPAEMGIAPVVPRTAERLGVVVASCESRDGWEAFEQRALSDVDCSRARLSAVMRELAAASGGDVLAAFSCSGRKRIRCTAEVARFSRAKGDAPVVAKAEPGPEGALGNAILVSFEPHRPRPVPARASTRQPRQPRELPALPASHRTLGTLTTLCGAECPELAVRDALRIAATRLGLEDVVGVRCLPWRDGYRCTARGAVSESRVRRRR